MRRGEVDCLPPCINTSGARFAVEGDGGSLRARRAQGRRRESDGDLGRRAGGRRAVRKPRRFRRAGRPAAAQPPPDRKPGRGRRLRCADPQPRLGLRSAPRPSSPMPQAPPTSARPGRAGCSAAVQTPASPRSGCPATRMEPGAADGGRARGLRLLFLRPPGRCARASARRPQGPAVRRAGLAADGGRRKPDDGDDGGAGRRRPTGAPRPRAAAI